MFVSFGEGDLILLGLIWGNNGLGDGMICDLIGGGAGIGDFIGDGDLCSVRDGGGIGD